LAAPAPSGFDGLVARAEVVGDDHDRSGGWGSKQEICVVGHTSHHVQSDSIAIPPARLFGAAEIGLAGVLGNTNGDQANDIPARQ
jgi:hypothetical protein